MWDQELSNSDYWSTFSLMWNCNYQVAISIGQCKSLSTNTKWRKLNGKQKKEGSCIARPDNQENVKGPRGTLKPKELLGNTGTNNKQWISLFLSISISPTITNVSYPKQQFTPFFEAILLKTIWILTAETCNQVSLQTSWALVSHKSGKKEALTDTVSAGDVKNNMS